jgi:hypothetical protein
MRVRALEEQARKAEERRWEDLHVRACACVCVCMCTYIRVWDMEAITGRGCAPPRILLVSMVIMVHTTFGFCVRCVCACLRTAVAGCGPCGAGHPHPHRGAAGGSRLDQPGCLPVSPHALVTHSIGMPIPWS